MNFNEMLLEMLLEGKIEDTLARHPTIPDDVKQDYLSKIPNQNAQHLDWVLSQHSNGNITSSHDIGGLLDTFNKVKDKLPKKQVSQYKSVDELHTAIVPHQDTIKKSDKEKSKEGTETLYSSPTMTIRQHHNYESTISAANLPENNVSSRDKAEWCVSVGDGGGAGHYSTYTGNGFHPVYTIEHHHSDGTSSKHMLVYNHNKTQDQQELRDENDNRPEFEDYSETRTDLLDHYGTEHPELKKTPIAKLFSDEGREEYKSDSEPAHKKLIETLANIPKTSMSDDEYMDYFKSGRKKRQGGIHNALAKSVLSPTQLTHLIEHGNEGSMHDIAQRQDLSDTHMQKLANTSNMLVHHHLLQRPYISDKVFNIIVKKAHPDNIPTIIKHQKFDATHLDAVLNKKISNDSLTSIVRRLGDKLEPQHIQKIIDKGDVHIHKHLIDKLYDKLEPQHITALKDSNIRTKFELENRVHDKLEPHDISRLISTGNSDVHNNLFSKIPKKLEPHIQELIDNGDDNTHRKIFELFKNKLDSTHISALIDKGNINTHHYISSEHLWNKLKPHHIQELIDKNKDYIDSNLLIRLQHKLESSHINSLIKNRTPESGIHHDILTNIKNKLDSDNISTFIDKAELYDNHSLVNNLSNKIEPHHISALIDKNDEDIDDIVVRKLHDKLEPHHIKSLIANGSSSLIKKYYQKLSTESKKEFSQHEQSLKDGSGELKEWYFTNNNFERLLKESLIGK